MMTAKALSELGLSVTMVKVGSEIFPALLLG